MLKQEIAVLPAWLYKILDNLMGTWGANGPNQQITTSPDTGSAGMGAYLYIHVHLASFP